MDSVNENDEHALEIRSLKQNVLLSLSGKINSTNVWQCKIIENLFKLVKLHHSYVGNFNTISLLLDATARVYGIRVDNIYNDVLRLYVTMGPRVPKPDEQSRHQVKSARRRANKPDLRFRNNIVCNSMINAPLKIRFPSTQFSTIKPNEFFMDNFPSTKCELQIYDEQRFFDASDAQIIQDNYTFDDCSYLKLNIDMNVDHLYLRSNDFLRGYTISDDLQDSIYKECNFDDTAIMSDCTSVENRSMCEVALDITQQIVSPENLDTLSPENPDILSQEFCDLVKGEYSYFTNVKNYWAGPSYWKIRQNTNAKTLKRKSQSNCVNIEKGKINIIDENDDPNIFISIESNKIRKIDFTKWNYSKLILPQKCNITKDYFNSYQYMPSMDLVNSTYFTDIPRNFNDYDNEIDCHQYYTNNNEMTMIMPSFIQNENVDEIDQNHEHSYISLHLHNADNAPQMIENISLKFERKAKVVNVKELHKITFYSIDEQLSSSDNERFTINRNHHEKYNEGRATFYNIYKALKRSRFEYLSKGFNITPALAFSSILHVASECRLRIGNVQMHENNFDILEISKK